MCLVGWLLSHDATVVLAVLVVATPCPLILAPPVAVIAAISRAARAGIIVKTGAAIEQLGLARAVVFDKTGTLTLGRPSVSRVRTLNGASPDEILRLAAALEQFSSNQLGTAIARAGQEHFATLPHPTDFHETAGAGVSGLVDGRRVHVGSVTLLEAHGVAVTEMRQVISTAYVAADGTAIGAIEFSDRLRHQVPSLMQRLAVLGVTDTIMLTGDHQDAAELIATQAGIRTVKADLLPADKVHAVEELKRRHGAVLMVGDGINDAPALAAATVGLALGAHGTAAPAAAADAVLLVDDISRVADAIEISRRMRRIALQSISVGVGLSMTLMVIASLGYITPAAGAIMQEALDAAVILNALRAR
jgi:P-type E1-E2 ATPase